MGKTNFSLVKEVNYSLCSLYEELFDNLLSIGVFHNCTIGETKDIIQQLFYDLARKNINLTAITNPRAYIITSFKRRVIDHHRFCLRKNKYAQSIYQETLEASIEMCIEDKEYQMEMVKKLKQSYDVLPDRCKKVIYYKFYEGLGNEEIAQKTGLSVRSVYNNLSTGIQNMRKALAVSKSENSKFEMR